MNELCAKGAAELASMIRSRQVTSTEVVEAYLARIDEVNPDLNAVRVTLADDARRDAAAVDQQVSTGAPLGPPARVPFTIKENIDVAGGATTWGVAALAEQIASTDAPVVARLRESGAIPLARTNLPDFAFRREAEMVAACLAQGVFRPIDQADQMAAWVATHEIGTAWTKFAQDYPIVLAPVCCERPWLVGDDVSRIGEIATAMRMVVPVNILGLPSCSVPVGSDDGLPQGVQLIGARLREDLLLDAAQAVEDRDGVITPIQPRVSVAA